ncbi:MAG: CRISPR-associated protein Csx3 [Candidatus Paceibacterota bacterium]
MTTYNINLAEGILKVGFCAPAQNDQIVKDACARLDEMLASGELVGGELMRVNGPASLPVAMVLAHKLGHLYGAVACFDPKLAGYVVAIAHGGKYAVGDLIE